MKTHPINSFRRAVAKQILGAALMGLALLPPAPLTLADTAPYLDRQIETEGVGLRLRVKPLVSDAPSSPLRGEEVELTLSVTRLADGQPLSNLPIGVWLDREISPLSGAVPVCHQRVASFLSGGLLTRPLVDLTGYWVLTLDQEGSVSVLDPNVVFAGRSSLYQAIQLGGQPFDWLKTPNEKLLFVALPERREVAMLDLLTLQLKQRLPVAGRPTRLALQPDARLLWVALRSAPDEGGDSSTAEATEKMAVLDAANGDLLYQVSLPPGHHEMAFSEDSRYAYVTSRDSGRLQVFDTATGKEVNDVDLGGQPLSVVSQASGDAPLWVIDGARGAIHRLDRQGRQVDRVVLAPGLGPARLTPDGRHVLIVNTVQQSLAVLDSSSAELVDNITISGRPYDIMFSELYVYVRSLDSDQVALFPLAQLPHPQPQYIAAGTAPVSALPNLPVASTMTPNLERSGAFFVVPSERTVYHYMEGMNAPNSSLRAFGHTPMAVLIVQRGLREVTPGEYTTVFSPPASGRMVLALAAESPEIRQCIGLAVSEPPRPEASSGALVQWSDEASVTVASNTPLDLQFTLENSRNNAPATELPLRARVVPGHGGSLATWPVTTAEAPGHYRVRGQLPRPGGYYIYIDSIDPTVLSIDAMSPPTAVIVNEPADISAAHIPAETGGQHDSD